MSNFRKHLHPGDQVMWTDPDNGVCSRTLIILKVEYLSEDVVRITDTEGIDLEAFLHELS